MSKFDVILLFAFVLIVAVCGANFYLAVNGLNQFDMGFWTFITAVCAGEIVTFSLYRIAKQKGLSIPKTIRGKHALIDEMEEEDGLSYPKTD